MNQLTVMLNGNNSAATATTSATANNHVISSLSSQHPAANNHHHQQQQQQYLTFQTTNNSANTAATTATINQQLTATGLAANIEPQQHQQHNNQLVTIQSANAYSPNIVLTNGQQLSTSAPTQGFMPTTNISNHPAATIQYILTPTQQQQQQQQTPNQQQTFATNGLMSNLITTPGPQINMIPINQTIQGTTTLLQPQLIANGCTTLQPTFIQPPSTTFTAANANTATQLFQQQPQQQFQVIQTSPAAATLTNGAITFQTNQLIGIPSTNQVGQQQQQQIILNPTIAQPQQQQLYQLVLPTNQILQPTNMITSSGQLITTASPQQQQQPTAITVPMQQPQHHGTLLTTTGGNLTFPQQQQQAAFLTQHPQQNSTIQMNQAIIQHQPSSNVSQQSSTNVFTTANHLTMQPCLSSGNGNNNNNYLNTPNNANTITLIATPSPTANISNQSATQSQANITTSSLNNNGHFHHQTLPSVISNSNNNMPIHQNFSIVNNNTNNNPTSSTTTTTMMVLTSSTAASSLASAATTNACDAGISQPPLVMFDDLIKTTSIKSINKKSILECSTTTTKSNAATATIDYPSLSSTNNSTIATGQTGFSTKACATENFNLNLSSKAAISTTSTSKIITPKLSNTNAEQNDNNDDKNRSISHDNDNTPSPEQINDQNSNHSSCTVNDHKIILDKNENEMNDEEKLNNALSASPSTPSIETSLATSPSQTSSTIIQRPSSVTSSCGSLKIADDDHEDDDGDEQLNQSQEYVNNNNGKNSMTSRKRGRSIDSMISENLNDDNNTDETEEMDLDSVETEIDSDCYSQKINIANNNDNNNNHRPLTSLKTMNNSNDIMNPVNIGIKFDPIKKLNNNNNIDVKNLNKSSANEEKDGYQSSYGGSPCHFTDTEDEEDDDDDTNVNVNSDGQLSSIDMNGEIKLIRRNGLTQAAYNLIDNRILMSSDDDNATFTSIESSIRNDDISNHNGSDKRNENDEKKSSNSDNNDRISIQIQTSLTASLASSSPSSIHSNGSSLIDTTTNECPLSAIPPASSTNPPLISSKERAIWTPEEQQLANEIQEFAKTFKLCRLSLGLTQSQVGQELSALGPCYSQSAICRFEKLDITLKSAKKIKPVLENWMREAEEKYRHNKIVGNVKPDALMNGLLNNLKDKDETSSLSQSPATLITPSTTASTLSSSFKISSALELVNGSNKNQQNTNNMIKNPLMHIMNGNQSINNSTTESDPQLSISSNIYKAFMESNKKRKRRTSFTPSAIDALNKYFEQNNHPNGEEMTKISEILNYDRDVVRVWFCNKRQATKAKCKSDNPNQSTIDESIMNDDSNHNKSLISSSNDLQSTKTTIQTQQPTNIPTMVDNHQFFARPFQHPTHGQALRSPSSSSSSSPTAKGFQNNSVPSVANIAPINLEAVAASSSPSTTTQITATNINSKPNFNEKPKDNDVKN